MAGDPIGEAAELPDDRDVAVRELWRRVFGPGDQRSRAAEGRLAAGSVAEGPGRIEIRLDLIDDHLGRIDDRLDRIDDRLARADDHSGRVETRLAVVETKMSTLETVATRLDATIVRLQDNSRTDFRLTFGAVIATALGLAGMMAKGFHWF